MLVHGGFSSIERSLARSAIYFVSNSAGVDECQPMHKTIRPDGGLVCMALKSRSKRT